MALVVDASSLQSCCHPACVPAVIAVYPRVSCPVTRPFHCHLLRALPCPAPVARRRPRLNGATPFMMNASMRYSERTRRCTAGAHPLEAPFLPFSCSPHPSPPSRLPISLPCPPLSRPQSPPTVTHSTSTLASRTLQMRGGHPRRSSCALSLLARIASVPSLSVLLI